ncbi:acyl-CoA thioesterase [Sinimarinibacterium sp. CAU 1509]|uniref:acyl-CoA thioesterase n=1 Tax=Sinimarinibacterium sp. CAU 1509 TaxID=2562283 RepID=UPI00200A3625|nr:thioesterase family protein [Sinimarinibacterium sp. CAU 1509]
MPNILQRSNFPHIQRISTRWKDNDIYGHVNNVEYYSYFDTVINSYLIGYGGLDIHRGDVIGVCAESHCRYLKALAFPHAVDAALRVSRIGRTSVRYDIALFQQDDDEAAAEGWFVHVFVDRAERRPTPLPQALRTALEALHIKSPES